MSEVWFLIAAGLAVIAAWAAVVYPRLFGSALWLAVSLFGVGLLYLFAGAEFLFLVQVIVYVGAIAVLILFTVMLQTPGPGTRPAEKLSPASALLPLGASILFGSALGLIALRNLGGAVAPVADGTGLTRRIGVLLLTREALTFEILSVILTVAAIAALVIAKKPPKDEA